jgi:integrase/recombinase XerD
VARKAAQAGDGFRGFRFHDLRHLYAVEYLKAGRGSLYDLQQLLGHASVKTTEIYLAFLTPEQKKDRNAWGGTKEGTAAAVR